MKMNRKFFYCACVFACVVMVSFNKNQAMAREHGESNLKKVIIDTDMAQDDLIAILMALIRPDIDILGISVVGSGEIDCGPGLLNVKKLLNLASYKHIPTACGGEKPLFGENNQHFPQIWKTQMNSLLGIPLPIGKPWKSPTANIDELYTHILNKEVLNNHDDITILALGPLTNIATLIDTKPELLQPVSQIVIMGGAVRVPGNMDSLDPSRSHHNAEFNIYMDPLAAQKVFRSPLKKVLVPLDATNTAKVSPQFFSDFKSQVSGPVGTFVNAVFQKVVYNSGKHNDDQAKEYFWDAIAAAVVIDPEIGSLETSSIDVVVDYETVDGKTQLVQSTSGRTLETPTGPIVSFYDHIDVDKFKQLVTELARN